MIAVFFASEPKEERRKNQRHTGQECHELVNCDMYAARYNDGTSTSGAKRGSIGELSIDISDKGEEPPVRPPPRLRPAAYLSRTFDESRTSVQRPQ